MSINKNFVVKNGFEVSTDLILANADTRRVGISSLNPKYTLDVAGGIGATHSYISGFSTVFTEFNVGTGGTTLTVLGIGGSIGIGTALPAYLLDIRSPVSTGQTALYVKGDVRITGDINIDDIVLDQADINRLYVLDQADINRLYVLGIGTLANLYVPSSGIATIGVGIVTNLSGTNLNYSGIGTITELNSTNGTITNLTGTAGTITNLSGTNLNYSGISTALRFVSTVSSGTAPLTVTSSTVVTNLNSDLLDGQQGSYYNDLTNSTGTLPDARFAGTYTGVSFNSIGIATFASFSGSGASLTSLNATNVSSGTLNNERLPSNISVTNLNITGVSTLGNVKISSGIVTATSGIVTYYGDGSGLINTPPASPAGSNNQIQYNSSGSFSASPNLVFNGNDLKVSGVVTATSFYGNGSNLSGITFGIGISSEGSLIGSGVTVIDFRGSGITTVSSGSGIGTIFIESPFTTAIIKETFTVTSSTQSVFNLSNPYGIGYIDVYLNGVKMTSDDYSESSPNQITLATEAVNGDVINIVNFKTVTIGITSALVSDLAYNLTGTPNIVVGNITANSVDSGGTSSQFVKGDGSLDSNNYSTFSKTVAMSLIFG